MKKFQKVYAHILDKISTQGGLTFMQLDPPNYNPELSGKIAKIATENGLDAFAVGGSVGAQGELLDATIKQIKENSDLPVILFPGNVATLSKYADALYFLSMLNSNDPYWITGAQISSAWPIKQLGLEVIPTSYIIVEPGMAVGWMGRAQPIPRDKYYLGAVTALAGQYLGAKLVIFESGGGSPTHAPPEMITQARKLVEVPILVAGGVKTPESVSSLIKAGADIVQVGSIFEKAQGDLKKCGELFNKITTAARNAGKEKLK
ncbi:MAG TPA: geranylgeranylglyceryl/heptaprenylglyceryl phosphate synthase [Candidatus Diapherotrites archaeon]|uniref:Geranylgeranylglyceryl phosphate synthase n=1 Tax=Candidatus Iainarchaeum sp. TaxID=3101447 RepID=A0A7J4KT71_9ARCH|nr:geranylgeranylglyceryl/heptaprenylglyceryl phosphate synthase [Candidatus Diapherotrites archaeon]